MILNIKLLVEEISCVLLLHNNSTLGRVTATLPTIKLLLGTPSPHGFTDTGDEISDPSPRHNNRSKFCGRGSSYFDGPMKWKVIRKPPDNAEASGAGLWCSSTQ